MFNVEATVWHHNKDSPSHKIKEYQISMKHQHKSTMSQRWRSKN